MPHLHEVLAVDKELEQIATKIVLEGMVTFTKKTDHFTGGFKQYKFFDEKREQEATGLDEIKELTTTVPEKLHYIEEHLIRFLDALAQKESTNQNATADVVLPGLIIEKLPATLLLALENKLGKLRPMYEALPTLQPGIEWVKDPSQGEWIYKAKDDIVRNKTEKTIRYKVLVEPTDRHPAQVEKWTEDVVIGQSTSTNFSGMITPAQKSALLKRLDDLVFALKQARMRANETEVVKISIGQILFDYINKGLEV